MKKIAITLLAIGCGIIPFTIVLPHKIHLVIESILNMSPEKMSDSILITSIGGIISGIMFLIGSDAKEYTLLTKTK